MSTETMQEQQEDQASYYLASQWKLVWWRFRRHKLAIVGTAVVLILYLVSLFPEFLAVYDPHERDKKKLYLAPTAVHFFDGWKPTPFVYGLKSARDPKTLKLIFEIDESKKYYLKFFAKGYEW